MLVGDSCMTTSGFYRSTADFLIDEDCCGYVGWVEATEDTEDMSVSWDCPECGHHEEGELAHGS